jgi:outer membrane receptor protein involved in Fe transport
MIFVSHDRTFLRGLANQSGSGALVSVYRDDAPLSLSGYDQLSPATLVLARVEVLKGPQGTLYGPGSAGGTIRYITNQPNLNEIEGRVEAQACARARLRTSRNSRLSSIGRSC